MEKKLVVNNLSRKIEYEFEIKPVSFELMPGTVCGIFGETGAGKTTFLRMLMRLYKRNSGFVTFGETEEFMADCAYIPDQIVYPLQMKIKDVAKLESTFYKNWDQARFEAYRAQFGLDNNMKIDKLSLGQRQRLMLAVSLSHKAELLIFDEPTDGIDPFDREFIMTTLREYLYEFNATALIATHNIKEVDVMIDYILYFEGGECALFCDVESLPQKGHRVLQEHGKLTAAFEAQPSVENFVQAMQGTAE